MSNQPGATPRAGKNSGGPRKWWLLPTIAALFIGIGLGGVGKSDGTTGAAAPTVTATVTKAGAAGSPAVTVTAPAVTVTAPAPAAVTVTAPAAPAAPPPGPGAVGDGVYIVGQDMQPGTYRVSAAVTDGCYWKITKSGSNGGEIVQNDLPKGGFPQVTVKAGQDFNSERCGTWVKK